MAAVKVLLLYPPLQFAPGAVPKPDGSLGMAYLAGALRDAGIEVSVLDAAVHNDAFDRHELLPSGLLRVGMSNEDILEAAAPFDVIGIGSTFTAQHSMALDTVRRLRAVFPEKRLLIGGVSARSFSRVFLDAGADGVFLSEADGEIVQACTEPLASVPGVATATTRTPAAVQMDLDRLPIPAWDLLPNETYWRIGRPHGGAFGKPVKYAAMMTSRGCPYSCSFCHISVEKPGMAAGDVGRFRTKSLARVLQELDALEALGVERIYIEDDSLLAKKSRILTILRAIVDRGFVLADVNGVNIAHLFTSGGVPDVELIEAMAACGFEELSLPFESASPRILSTYASKKWSPAAVDTVALVHEMGRAGIGVSGNYMLGFPDETEEEIAETIALARAHREAGLTEANFFVVVPFPGTTLFSVARQKGYLPQDWNPDDMVWFKPIMRGTTVPNERLKELRELAWRELNDSDFIGARERAAV